MKIDYKDEFTEASITLRPATLRDVFAHDDLEKAVRKELQETGEEEIDSRLYFQKLFVYPSCISCVQGGFIKVKKEVEHPKKPGEKKVVVENIDPRAIEFDRFLDLPNSLLALWIDGAWKENANWEPRDPATPEAEQENRKKT